MSPLSCLENNCDVLWRQGHAHPTLSHQNLILQLHFNHLNIVLYKLTIFLVGDMYLNIQNKILSGNYIKFTVKFIYTTSYLFTVKDVHQPKSNRDVVRSTSCKSDEAAAQLHNDLSSKVQIHSNTELATTTNNNNTTVHQGVNKRESHQQTNTQKGTDRLTVLERAFAEMQISYEIIRNQLYVTQQQLEDVQKTNSNLQNQLSLTQQQLLGVQSMMTCSRLWVVSHDQFTIGRELGRGAWATVHETEFRGATVAAKCLHQLITTPKTKQLFQQEMEMALQCQHQNIVTFLGATLEGPPVILMELMDSNLRSAYEQGNIKDHQVSGILYATASALHFLHTRPDPVIHRDVSSANVLLKAQYNEEWLAKLGDLGTAKIQQQAATAGPGAIAYGAPEAGDFTKHSPKMDVYSYGVLILEVLTKTHPFQMVDALKVQVQKQFPHYHQMVTSCINQQSSDRPTMYDVIQQLDMIKLTKN